MATLVVPFGKASMWRKRIMYDASMWETSGRGTIKYRSGIQRRKKMYKHLPAEPGSVCICLVRNTVDGKPAPRANRRFPLRKYLLNNPS